MAMTLHQILALEVFQRAEAEVVACHRHLDRSVRWVHIAELTDIGYLLKGGELLLTTGMGLGDDSADQRRYVDNLSKAGPAGLVLELGRYFRKPPRALIVQAERRELPVILLHKEARFVEITEEVHRAIMGRQYDLLRKADTMAREFTSLLLAGGGTDRVVRQLANIVGNPVVLEDTAHQVVEVAPRDGSVDAVFDDWAHHSRLEHGRPDGVMDGPMREPTAGCMWIGISFRDQPWGRIHIIERDRPLDEIDQLALDRAAAAVSLALLTKRHVAHMADDARGTLLAYIEDGRYGSEIEVQRRAKVLGVKLVGPNYAVLMAEDISAEAEVSDDDGMQRAWAGWLSDVRLLLGKFADNALIGMEGSRVAALFALGTETDPRASAQELGDALSKSRGLARVILGCSRGVRFGAIAIAFVQARDALRYGIASPGSGTMFHFDDLSLDHLLLKLADGPELARYVEAELHALLEHDAKSSMKLVPTLRAYFDAGNSKSAAAKRLHLERRSLYHRLDRIALLLRVRLDDPEVRAKLIVALRALELLSRNSPLQAKV
jgi:PucR family transcriptional regulator, purine catabolism regulatory protein